LSAEQMDRLEQKMRFRGKAGHPKRHGPRGRKDAGMPPPDGPR
jgi:hypothetical protein